VFLGCLSRRLELFGNFRVITQALVGEFVIRIIGVLSCPLRRLELFGNFRVIRGSP